MKTIKTIAGIAAYIDEYLEEDASHRYSLLEPITYPPMLWGLGDGVYEDAVLRLAAAGGMVVVTLKAFIGDPAKPAEWDGVSLVEPDELDRGLFLGSLLHDVMYGRLDEVARAFHVEVGAVRKWADDAFATLAKHYGTAGWKRAIAYRGVRWFGGLYHWLKGHLSAIGFWLFLLGLCGVVASGGCALMRTPDLMPGYEGPMPVPVYEKVCSADGLWTVEAERRSEWW